MSAYFPLALQQTYVHLCRQVGCIKFFDHLHRRSSIARQSEQVDTFAVQQAKHDRRVAQAVQASGLTELTLLESCGIQDFIEVHR